MYMTRLRLLLFVSIAAVSGVLCSCTRRDRNAEKHSEKSEAIAETEDESSDSELNFKSLELPDKPVQAFPDSAGTKQLIALDFYADWCGPCQELKPYMEEFERRYGNIIQFKEINIDNESELADRFGIEAIPTVIIMDSDGNVYSRTTGLNPDEIEANLRAAAGNTAK